MEIEKLEKITSGLSTALPSASVNAISIAQAVNYLTYKINECVDIINRIDPDVYTKEIDTIKENLEAIEKSIDEKTEDINTINGKITSINLSIDTLNEALGHKVSHTNSTSVVYANDASGNETPIKFTCGTDSGTIALRTSTGQVAVADATADNHAVGYKQMKDYVSTHSSGIAYYKKYSISDIVNSYSITDAEDLEVLNGGFAHLVIGCWVSFSGGSDYRSVNVLLPPINHGKYKPRIMSECSANTSTTGVSIERINIEVVQDGTSITINLTVAAGQASVTRSISSIEIYKF